MGGECVFSWSHPGPLPLLRSRMRTTYPTFKRCACLPVCPRLHADCESSSSRLIPAFTEIDALQASRRRTPRSACFVSPTHGKVLHGVDCVHCCCLLYKSTCMSMSRLGKRGCTVLVLCCRGQFGTRVRSTNRRICAGWSRLSFAIRVVSERVCSICARMHP